MKLIQSWDKKDQLTDIRFSPSGQQLVLIAKGLVSVIHAETGKIIRELKGVGAVAGVEVDHDARRLFRRGGNGRATLWDVRTGKQLADFVPEKDSFPRVVRGARFGGLGEQPEGPLFVWGSGSRIGLRDSTTGKPIRSVSIDGRITQIEVLPSGEFLLAMGDALGAEKRVWLFHAPTGTRHAVLKHKHTIWRARFVDGGRHVLTVEARADTQRREDQVTRVHLWSVASGDKLASVFYPTLVTDIDYLESTSQIVARLPQGDVRPWQLPRPTPMGRKTAVLQVEARTGMRLNSNGQLQALDAKTWQAVKGKLNALYRK